MYGLYNDMSIENLHYHFSSISYGWSLWPLSKEAGHGVRRRFAKTLSLARPQSRKLEEMIGGLDELDADKPDVVGRHLVNEVACSKCWRLNCRRLTGLDPYFCTHGGPLQPVRCDPRLGHAQIGS